MKVAIINGNSQYSSMYLNEGWDVGTDIEDADLVQFTGGSDVHPNFYDEELHPYSMCSLPRDKYERGVYDLCVERGIPMVGICRGGQFLNVMNGGRMLQHVTGHATGEAHMMTDCETSHRIEVTSTHHQMMVPAPHAVVVAVAKEMGDKETMDAQGQICEVFDEVDYEVLYYPDTKSLCFQPHPEFPGYPAMTSYFFEQINHYIGMMS